MDHYTCVSGGEFLDVFIPPKPKILNPKPKGDGKKKEPFGPILAFKLFQVIMNFLAELTFTFIGADSTRVNTGIYRKTRTSFGTKNNQCNFQTFWQGDIDFDLLLTFLQFIL